MNVAYLFGCVVYLGIWAFLYFRRRDLRHPMVGMSIFIGMLSVVSAWWWWTKDWWHPETITGTRVGLEDFLLGFGVGGIAVVIYEEIFRQKLIRRSSARHTRGFVMLWTTVLGTISLLFWGLRLTSFWSFVVGGGIIALTLLVLRWDLHRQALMSGLLLVVVSLPFYWSIIALHPEWVSRTYDWQHLSHILWLGVPIEE